MRKNNLNMVPKQTREVRHIIASVCLTGRQGERYGRTRFTGRRPRSLPARKPNYLLAQSSCFFRRVVSLHYHNRWEEELSLVASLSSWRNPFFWIVWSSESFKKDRQHRHASTGKTSHMHVASYCADKTETYGLIASIVTTESIWQNVLIVFGRFNTMPHLTMRHVNAFRIVCHHETASATTRLRSLRHCGRPIWRLHRHYSIYSR